MPELLKNKPPEYIYAYVKDRRGKEKAWVESAALEPEGLAMYEAGKRIVHCYKYSHSVEVQTAVTASLVP